MNLKYLYKILFLLSGFFTFSKFSTDMLYAQTVNGNSYFSPSLKEYRFKGEVPLIEGVKDEHKITLLRSGWSENQQGHGFYFYTYRSPQVFVDYMLSKFGKPKVLDKQYNMPFPDIENWKYYQWKNVSSWVDPALKVDLSMDVRSYYDATNMYVPYYEFFIRPSGSGTSVSVTESLAENIESLKWINNLQIILDSVYKNEPAIIKDPTESFFAQHSPVNKEEMDDFINPSAFNDFTQEVIEVSVNTNGKIFDKFIHYHITDKPVAGLFDSTYLSKLVYPKIQFLGHSIPYQTLLFFEYNPFETREQLFLEKLSLLVNDTLETNKYSIYQRINYNREFYFAQLGRDSMFVFEKNISGFHSLFSLGHTFDFWNDYYNTYFELEDFNHDGWTDILIRYGEPFNGSGSQMVSMYVFDPAKNGYKNIPQFSEYDVNEIVPYVENEGNYLAVYTSGGNFGTQFKYKYEWLGLELNLLEYATTVVKNPGDLYWYEVIEYYKKINGKLRKVFTKRMKDQDKAYSYFQQLVYPHSVLRYY